MISKYRAWDKRDKEIYLVYEVNWDDGKFDYIGDAITFYRGAEEVELMQSTGLFDKNGKEIFEKDILDYNGRKVIVKWHGSYASFIYEFVDELKNRKTEWKPLYLSYYKFEVIGNIYENPELLEVEI
ncbi:YopX family protein [Streptococcus sp. S1]|uniref:YopX family protein n=1 Tax=Streptococcus dentalis TaxID=3098075 RepID=A0ABZ0T469_9STRE|nr:YopX family protein [Streptococcus sp. S1]WPS54794.1 YopX family protein [Streptococcus sp. S1]